MGNNISYKKDNNIIIITYNTKINFFSTYKNNKIINYLSNFKDKNIIICLQGINDEKSKNHIITNISKYYKLNNIVPSKINNINTGNFMFITNFDIIKSNYLEFNIDDNIFEYNKRGVLINDILIKDRIMTIYNTELYEDISNNINLKSYRERQLIQLVNLVKEKINIKDNNHNGLHVILGSLYVDEIDNKNLFDIIKFYNNKLKEENNEDFILFFVKKMNTNMINLLKVKFNIEIINISIRDELNYSKNLPLELIIKFNNNISN